MTTERLEVRLDRDRRRKLDQIADDRGVTVSEVVRSWIDEAYEAALRERRIRAAEAIGRMKIEHVPDPDELARQLHETHAIHGLH